MALLLLRHMGQPLLITLACLLAHKSITLPWYFINSRAHTLAPQPTYLLHLHQLVLSVNERAVKTVCTLRCSLVLTAAGTAACPECLLLAR